MIPNRITERPHDLYACYSCPENIRVGCRFRRRAKYMSCLDQWIYCSLMRTHIHLPVPSTGN